MSGRVVLFFFLLNSVSPGKFYLQQNTRYFPLHYRKSPTSITAIREYKLFFRYLEWGKDLGARDERIFLINQTKMFLSSLCWSTCLVCNRCCHWHWLTFVWSINPSYQALSIQLIWVNHLALRICSNLYVPYMRSTLKRAEVHAKQPNSSQWRFTRN